MSSRLDEIAQRLPARPGVYLFKDRRGRVLYVGKAVDVRARVRQYLSGHDGRSMVPYLVQAAADVEAIVTTTEKEALLLENTLIKKHRPRFNVKLRDDSNFLHLRLDLREGWPRYRLVRAFGDCYGYYLVATGLADVMVEPDGLKYHDVAPLSPILKGAGGNFTDLSGKIDLANGQGLATNQLLHQQALAALQAE